MKKHFISILLIVVILLAMTGCANSNAISIAPIQTEAEIFETETFESEVPETEALEPELEIEYLSYADIGAMKVEEISEYLAKTVNISETATLSVEDMNIIADTFYNIWNQYHSTDYQKEFDLQFYTVFCNIHEQTLNYNIPLEQLSSWTHLPVPIVLCEYFSSSNFDFPEALECSALDYLDKEDATKVIETFFANPSMETNTIIPCTLILFGYTDYVQNMAWLHFDNLSKNISPKTSLPNDSFTSLFCENLLVTGLDSENIMKIANVFTNILENPYYDIQAKYVCFFNPFYDFVTATYPDTDIFSSAIDSLLNLAKTADQSTREQLYELIDNIPCEVSTALLSVLDGNSVLPK